MPPKRARRADRRGGARADVGAILEITDFLPRFLADGLVAWLLSAEPAASQRSRGAVAATMRILCRDLREAVDKELTALMQRLVGLITNARECSVKLRQRKRASDEGGIHLAKRDMSTAICKLFDITQPCFGSNTSRQIQHDIVEFSGITTRLLAHPGTFLAMAQQRCQLSLRHANVCSVAHLVSNFTEVRTPDRAVCVYARPKARDNMVIYRTCFLQNVGTGPIERDNFDLARAMLRLRDVFFPCSNGEILAAFGGRHSGLEPSELFVERHPHFDPIMSVEGLLELSPQEAARARAAVALSKRLAHERECRIAAIERENMATAMDEHIRDSTFIPGIHSLEDLGKSCAGMEKCVRVMISKLKPGHLAPVDSMPVRNALATARAFLRDVTAAQKKLAGGVSSSEAYDFVSGMHVGHYSAPSTGGQHEPGAWPRWHDGLHLCPAKPLSAGCAPRAPEDYRSIDSALRFFDSLGDAQLERASQTPKGMVPRYRLEAGGVSVEFDANWVDCWEACQDMQLGIQRLVRGSGLDPASWSVPSLSKEDFSDYHRLRKANQMEYINPAYRTARGEKGRFKRADAHAHARWTEAVFSMLVAEPSTRCGALSVAGLHTGILLSAFPARDALR
jgi:hypothetical protein